MYLGNPVVHSLAGGLYAGPLRKALGSRNIFTASTVDQMPKHVQVGHMYGSIFSIPVPDIDRTDFMLVLGADPFSSNGSLWTVPDVPGRFKDLQKRGGKFVVVDPRRSRTAQAADQHIVIRPGSDVFLLLALIHELFARGPGEPQGRRRARHRPRPDPRARRRVHARSRRRTHRHRRGDHPRAGPADRRCRTGRRLRPHRHDDRRVRHDRELGGRHAQHPHRQPGPAGRRDVGRCPRTAGADPARARVSASAAGTAGSRATPR